MGLKRSFMELRKVLVLRGPNLWTTSPALEAWLDIGVEDQQATAAVEARERLMEFCADLHGACGLSCHDGTQLPFHDETDLARLVGRCANELQSVISGTRICFLYTTLGNEPLLNKVVIGFEFDTLARACLETAFEFCQALIGNAPYDTKAAIARLHQVWMESRPSELNRAIQVAARHKGIPVLQLPVDQYQQLGWGSRQRRFMGSLNDRTSSIAESIANDPQTTRSLLGAVGVPLTAEFVGDRPAEYSLLVIGNHVAAALHRAAGETQDGMPSVSDAWIVHAVEACRVIGLDIAEVQGEVVDGKFAIAQLVARPDLDTFCRLSPLIAQQIGNAVVESLFPNGQSGRIPIACVTGTNGKTTTTRMIAHIVSLTGKRVGMTCTDGIYVAGRRIDHDDCSGPRSARNVLMNPNMEAVVLETARGGMLREGLAFDQCDVAVVMNIGEGDHLGLNDIHTPEQLARVKRIIVTAVARNGSAVLKADDPLVAAMAAHCPGQVIFFCLDGDHPVIVKHRLDGGRVVFVRDKSIVLAEGSLEIPLLSVDRIPLTHHGKILFQVENALATTAANWALGTPAEIIRNGLESFAASIDKSPGRFNLLESGGATIVVDYGHNTSSLAAMLGALEQFPPGRRVAVYSAAGDRRDCDMIRQGEMLGNSFDRVLVYEDQYVRGREPGEIMALFSKGLKAGRRVQEVHAISGWEQAAEQALKSLRPGDLLLLQADTIDEAVELVNRHLACDKDIHEVIMSEALDSMPQSAPATSKPRA